MELFVDPELGVECWNDVLKEWSWWDVVKLVRGMNRCGFRKLYRNCRSVDGMGWLMWVERELEEGMVEVCVGLVSESSVLMVNNGEMVITRGKRG